MKDNCLVNRTLTVEITGVSTKSKEDAINQAFGNLRAEVSKVYQDLIVYMKPLGVQVKNIEEYEYTERFLFIFWPRKRARVKITLVVTVEVSLLQV